MPRSRHGQARSVSLVALCGVPSRYSGAVADAVEKQLRQAQIYPSSLEVKVESLPATKGQLYPEGSVEDFAGRIARRVLNGRLRNGEEWDPRYLQLVFVRSPDEERLLSKFGLAPFLVPVAARSDQLEQVDLTTRRVVDAVVHSEQGRDALRACIESSSMNSPGRLPPRNFQASGSSLYEQFTRVQRGELQMSVVEKGVSFTRYKKWRVPCDERDRIFPADKSGHGILQREALQELDRELRAQGAPRRVLERLFRFGFPLRDGFHHDVQRLDERHFDGEVFFCSKQGEVQVRGSHVNVYPDDFVRCV